MTALFLFTTRDFTHPCELNPSHSGRAEQIFFSCDIVAEYTINMSCGRKGDEEGGRRKGEGGRGEEEGGKRKGEGGRGEDG